MDKIDRKILAELQADGRLSVTELAERIGLSVSLPPPGAGVRGVRGDQVTAPSSIPAAGL